MNFQKKYEVNVGFRKIKYPINSRCYHVGIKIYCNGSYIFDFGPKKDNVLEGWVEGKISESKSDGFFYNNRSKVGYNKKCKRLVWVLGFCLILLGDVI